MPARTGEAESSTESHGRVSAGPRGRVIWRTDGTATPIALPPDRPRIERRQIRRRGSTSIGVTVGEFAGRPKQPGHRTLHYLGRRP
jgi:hypothetical protein